MKIQKHFLDSFFNPAGIAVVGDSRNPLKISHNLLANLINLKFPGQIYIIHPGIPEMRGIKAYPNLQAMTAIEWLEAHKIPVYPSGERAVKSLAPVHRYSRDNLQ